MDNGPNIVGKEMKDVYEKFYIKNTTPKKGFRWKQFDLFLRHQFLTTSIWDFNGNFGGLVLNYTHKS